MLHPFPRCFIAEAQYFHEIGPCNPALLLYGKSVCGVADIPYGGDTCLIHLPVCFGYGLLYVNGNGIPFGHYLDQEFNEPGARGHQPFQVAEFQVAVGIDESRAEQPGNDVNIVPCVFPRQDRFHGSVCANDQHRSGRAECLPVKEAVGLYFPVTAHRFTVPLRP